MIKNNLQKNIAMKDSGVEWIGEIPSDWDVSPLLRFFTISKDKVKEGVLNPLSVGYMGVVPQLENAAKNIANGDRKYVKVGDVVINGRSDRMGAVGLSKYEGGVSLVYHILRPKFDFENKFFHYLFRNKMFSQEFYKHGNGIVADLWTTKDSELKRIQAPTPPKPTQEKIVAFLDEKTEAVAELVEKKKKMIELLKEKRSSLITHAVTKGLPARRPARSRNAGGDENEKCPPASGWKDSGVEWIGEIPEGWEVKRLKNVSTYNDEILNENTPDDFEFEYIDISSVNLSDGIKTTERVSYNNAPSRARRVVRVNDIIVSTVRTYLRAIATITNKYAKCIVSTGFAVIRPKKIKESFLSYFMQSENFVFSVINHSEGVAYPAINASRLVELNILIPPKQTQQKIVEFLDKETAKIDKVISKIEKQIELLDEYKASLIYHAVTGKIEV